MPVTQARPLTSGITAGRSPTRVSSSSRPVNRLPITDSLTNSSPSASSPRRLQRRHPRRGAGPARRAVEPPRMDRRRIAGMGTVVPGLVEDDVLAAGDRRVQRMSRSRGCVDRVDRVQSGLDQALGVLRHRIDDCTGSLMRDREVSWPTATATATRSYSVSGPRIRLAAHHERPPFQIRASWLAQYK